MPLSVGAFGGVLPETGNSATPASPLVAAFTVPSAATTRLDG